MPSVVVQVSLCAEKLSLPFVWRNVRGRRSGWFVGLQVPVRRSTTAVAWSWQRREVASPANAPGDIERCRRQDTVWPRNPSISPSRLEVFILAVIALELISHSEGALSLGTARRRTVRSSVGPRRLLAQNRPKTRTKALN